MHESDIGMRIVTSYVVVSIVPVVVCLIIKELFPICSSSLNFCQMNKCC